MLRAGGTGQGQAVTGGGDKPSQQKRIDKQRNRIGAANIFEVIAREWRTNNCIVTGSTYRPMADNP